MNFNRVLANDAVRAGPTDQEIQSAAERRWRERGYNDAKAKRSRLDREVLRELGGSDAVRHYFAGYRAGQK